MRDFIDIVSEGRWPRLTTIEHRYLFHGTSIVNAAWIMRGDGLWAADDDEGEEYRGVSTTSNFRRAYSYGTESTRRLHHDFESGYHGMPPGMALQDMPKEGAVLVFDAPKLVRELPVHVVRYGGNESDLTSGERPEERVLGSIQPARDYIVGIVADRGDVEGWLAVFEKAAALPPDAHFDPEMTQQTVDALRALLASPLLMSAPPA